MLLRMMPDQIARHWEETFKGPMQATLPPIAGESLDRMNNILESFLAGGLAMWLSYTKTDSIKVSGFIVTQVIADAPSGTLALLIYSVYSPDGSSDQEWAEGFAGLCDYARARNCNRVIAYSNVEQIFKRAEQFGGDISYRFISFPLI